MPRARRNDKRDRLIQAADKLIYEKTFHTTTLADIAKAADVPLGNVYYYFKTKEEIVMAVIESRSKTLGERLIEWEALPSVVGRLEAFLQYFAQESQVLARFGCTIGSLCQELGKTQGPMSQAAAQLMQDMIGWAEKQFVAMGKSAQDAHRLAEHFIANIQGMNLLTLTFREPDFCQRQTHALSAWLRSV